MALRDMVAVQEVVQAAILQIATQSIQARKKGTGSGDSGKKKAHKHKQFCPVTAWVRGGSLDWAAMGPNVYVLCAEPKEHKHFGPGTRPGGSGTGVTAKVFMCQMFMCLF